MDFDSENTPSNPAPRGTIGEIIAQRYSRRGALLGGLAATLAVPAGAVPMRGGPSTLTFSELRQQLAQTDAVAEGHESRLLIRWGDPVLADAPAFDPRRPGPAIRLQQ